MPQFRQQPVAMRRAQLLMCLLPALLMPPEWDAAICAQFAIARTGVPQQGCINNTPATITAGTDWDIIHSDSAEVSLDAPPSGFDFNTGLELDTIHSCAVESDLHLDVQQSVTRVDAPLSRAEVNKALFEARLESLSDTELKFPWESGVMGDIFSESSVVASLPTLPAEFLGFTDQMHAVTDEDAAPSTSQRISSRALELPFYSFAIKIKPDKDLFAAQEVLWTKAIDKWIQVFEVLGFPWQMGEALDSELHFEEAAEQGMVLRDALGVKSPRTAVKRAQTLLQFLRWLHDNCSSWEPWSRANCLAYLSSTDDRRPAASLGVSFLEAIRFARHVLQVPIPDALPQDPQLKGRAQRLMLTKDVYHPARPLKAQEVAILERMRLGHMDTVDKYMLGAVLFFHFFKIKMVGPAIHQPHLG